MSDKLIELNCMVCGEPFMGKEPMMCCSGRDCGCLGMPTEPVVCSEKCYNNLPFMLNRKQIQMTEKEIKARMGVLNTEIFERNKELSQLTKDLLSLSTDPYVRFSAWANNGMIKKTLDYLPARDTAMWKYIDKDMDLGAMRGTVELLNFGKFELFSMPAEDLEEDPAAIEDIEILKKNELFCAACEEMIKGNYDSFQMNW